MSVSAYLYGMLPSIKKVVSLLIVVCVYILNARAQSNSSEELLYRPRLHFSPKAHWINDPNGMIYYKGVYHLFFQYHPYSSVWGPMHWGHASSTDLVHWKELPVAIYPDSTGTIFSGSAVFDKNNTSGLGKPGQPPLVAIFTQHNEKGEKEKQNNFQTQSIAYSIDNGYTWTKYKGNPVLKNPGIRDFRDPKVSWHEPSRQWIMTLATSDHITFYHSPNLKDWSLASEFGSGIGAHGGVWECPDLFTLDFEGKSVWVLIANLNPGAPNKGSGTQYFLGNFDGKIFSPFDTKTRWIDYGPDDYAGITWSNTGKEKIFLGWMSNWMYAERVPTTAWRNAMTLPRKLSLKKINEELLIASEPISSLNNVFDKPVVENYTRSEKDATSTITLPVKLDIEADAGDFLVRLHNDAAEELRIGYNAAKQQYFIDRRNSGQTSFQNDFASIHTAPRFASGNRIKLTLVFDVNSVELFADNGLTVMTELFFPTQPYNKMTIAASADESTHTTVRKQTYKRVTLHK